MQVIQDISERVIIEANTSGSAFFFITETNDYKNCKPTQGEKLYSKLLVDHVTSRDSVERIRVAKLSYWLRQLLSSYDWPLSSVWSAALNTTLVSNKGCWRYQLSGGTCRSLVHLVHHVLTDTLALCTIQTR